MVVIGDDDGGSVYNDCGRSIEVVTIIVVVVVVVVVMILGLAQSRIASPRGRANSVDNYNN